jgi:hypothetical protein
MKNTLKSNCNHTSKLVKKKKEKEEMKDLGKNQKIKEKKD